MNTLEFRDYIAAQIRFAIATAKGCAELNLPPLPSDPSNAAVQRGSPLWRRLAIQTDDCGDGSGYCSECGYETERYDLDDEDWVCAECNAELVRGQEEDHRLDSPTHGQAASLNRKFWEMP